MRYDTTLKELLQAGTPQLWSALIGQPVREFLTVELPSVQMRKPDFLARLDDGVILHLEIQSDNDRKMEWRELEYYQWIYRLYERPPMQCVLYVGAAPLTMNHRIVFESLQFRYRLVDIRNIGAAWMLMGDTLADNLLAVLCDYGTEVDAVEAITRRIGRLPKKEQRDWFEKLMILSGLRGAEFIVREEARKMGISVDIRENKFFQEAYAAGIKDGEQKVLLRQLERRFGVLPEWVLERVKQADSATLEEASLRLLDAANLAEVFPGEQS